jgi:hypothetical protein
VFILAALFTVVFQKLLTLSCGFVPSVGTRIVARFDALRKRRACADAVGVKADRRNALRPARREVTWRGSRSPEPALARGRWTRLPGRDRPVSLQALPSPIYFRVRLGV